MRRRRVFSSTKGARNESSTASAPRVDTAELPHEGRDLTANAWLAISAANATPIVSALDGVIDSISAVNSSKDVSRSERVHVTLNAPLARAERSDNQEIIDVNDFTVSPTLSARAHSSVASSHLSRIRAISSSNSSRHLFR